MRDVSKLSLDAPTRYRLSYLALPPKTKLFCLFFRQEMQYLYFIGVFWSCEHLSVNMREVSNREMYSLSYYSFIIQQIMTFSVIVEISDFHITVIEKVKLRN